MERAALHPEAATAFEMVQAQFSSLARIAELPTTVESRLRDVLSLLTADSLDQRAGGPFQRLSGINANGLPFQWVLRTSAAGEAFGFVCEVGNSRDSPYQRFLRSRAHLKEACALCTPATTDWLDGLIDRIVPVSPQAWPEHWLSGIWIGVSPSPAGVVLKPYFNLNLGSARERWLRAGYVLQALGRHSGLASLCALSARISGHSWPVGLAVDILPSGRPGRVKIYFRSESVRLEWLECWYESTGYSGQASLVRACLEHFPLLERQRYPAGAFVTSLEFHPDETLGLKTDLAVTKWMASDAAIHEAAKSLSIRIGSRARRLDSMLRAVGSVPADRDGTRSFRFVGLGHEPDGSSHLNLYLEPRARSPGGETPARPRHSILQGLRAGIRFLLQNRTGDCWQDFNLPVGPASAWTTAYTLARLAGVPLFILPQEGACAIKRSLDWLVDQRRAQGGWGYNETVPEDADSTAWAVLALKRHQVDVPGSALELLRRCGTNDGWFTTYPPDAYGGSRWHVLAPDVSVLAMAALGDPWDQSAEDRFSGLCNANGLLPAYWWRSSIYTTAIRLEMFPGSAPSPSMLAALCSQDATGSLNSFDTALLLGCIARLRQPAARRLACDLVRRQEPDGSWPSSAFLRLPPAHVRRPWETIDSGALYADRNRIFTTATVVAALSTHLHLLN